MLKYEEALEHLKLHEYWADFSWMDEVAELAIEAIKKQMPKKPMQDATDYKFGVERCSICKGIVGTTDYHESFCGRCGQAIDWSIEE